MWKAAQSGLTKEKQILKEGAYNLMSENKTFIAFLRKNWSEIISLFWNCSLVHTG